MNILSDPPRLLEGTTLSDEDRQALSAYAAQAPGVERRAAMFDGLSRQLEVRGEAASAASSVRWEAGKLKLLLGAASVLASVIGLFLLWPGPAARPSDALSHTTPAVASPALITSPQAAVGPAVAAPVSELPAVAEPGVVAPAAHAKPRRLAGLLRAPDNATPRLQPLPLEPESGSLARRADPVAELALLARARRALLTRPAHALEFTEAHARDFPLGTFGEEREVLAIEALLRLHLDQEAKQRAMAFEQHFPNSAHRAHLARMIQAPDR